MESALIALDDATDEKSLAEIVEHCTVLSASLSEIEKIRFVKKLKRPKSGYFQLKKIVNCGWQGS